MNKSKDKDLIEYICAKYSISQTQLANKTGKTKQYISSIVSGNRNMSKDLYDRLAELFPEIFTSKFELPEEINNMTLIMLREYYRLSQSALARQLDVKPALISQIEKGSRGVSKAIKNKIRMLYSPDEFNKPKNSCVHTQNALLEELINRADTKVITIDKSTKYLVIKIDDSDVK